MPTRTETPKRGSRTRAPSAEPVVRTVNGLAVTKDVPLPSPLKAGDGTPVVFPGYRRLTLEDGTQLTGCGECPNSTDFTGTRGEVQRHRAAVHGMRAGGAPRKKATDQVAIPASIRAMTLDELLTTATEIEQLGDLVNTLTAERDEFKKRATTAEMQVRRWERAFSNLGLVPNKENIR